MMKMDYPNLLNQANVYFTFLLLHPAFCSLFNYTHTHAHIYNLRSLKLALKHLKRPYMFRSHDHPQGAYIVPC